MRRLRFNSSGKPVSVDSSLEDNFYAEESDKIEDTLLTSESLKHLEDSSVNDNSKDKKYWSLYSNGKALEPLRFSNGKTQEDVVREVVEAVERGKKIIFIHGVCGTGKSAIALNISRALGRASIVVPVKALQKQYEEDYTDGKYLLKQNGKKMHIAMLTGRENHDSVIQPGVSCADPMLPDTIPLTEKNFAKLAEYYAENPVINHKIELKDVSRLKRISVAPSNPYWSPIVPAEIELPLKDAKKKKYVGLNGRDFIFYHRQTGCSYYDQYNAYIDSDVLIFNAAKYKIEVALDRKPSTSVDIVDEADEFLDSFSLQHNLNITRLGNSLKSLYPDEGQARDDIDRVQTLVSLEEKRAQAIGVNEDNIIKLNETNIQGILSRLATSKPLQAEVEIDDTNYASKCIEIAKQFSEAFDETYVTYRKDDKDLIATLVTTNVARKFKELADKLNVIVLMSGTLHSEAVLKEIFGINDYIVIDAENKHQGTLEIQRTGKEMDCRYSNFASGKYTKDQYYLALDTCVQRAKKPVLIHVNSFEDLPSSLDATRLGISQLMVREDLKLRQSEDKSGMLINKFKKGDMPELFSTKCARGVDFPGSMCNSIVFTKYPNPDVRGTFWKILQKTHPHAYWDFYKDKAWREFVQRVYRALRSKNDHVFVLSPDLRVLDAARAFQEDRKI